MKQYNTTYISLTASFSFLSEMKYGATLIYTLYKHLIILRETPETKLTLQLRTTLSLPSFKKSHRWALPALFSLSFLSSLPPTSPHTHAWMDARWRGEAYLDVMSLWTLPLKLNHNCVMSDTALYMTQMKSSIFPWIESSISPGDKARLQYLIICLLRAVLQADRIALLNTVTTSMTIVAVH